VSAIAFLIASSTGLDWMVCGCVGLVLTSVGTYRTVTRRFGWGPSDT